MSDIDDGGPAFPAVQTRRVGEWGEFQDVVESIGGMTLRDYFAAKAMVMHGTACMDIPAENSDAWNLHVAQLAYATADAMLRARKKA